MFKLTSIYELPFGQGKKFGSSARGWTNKLISGWQATGFFVNPNKGFPAALPSNVVQLRDPKTALGWSGETDFKANQVRAWSPCVARQNTDGTTTPMPYALTAGCGTDISKYVWLFTSVGTGAGSGYEPRYTPNRSSQIRRHKAFQLDASILKSTQVTERIRVQFGFEAFNLEIGRAHV